MVELREDKERLRLVNYAIAQPESETLRLAEFKGKEMAGILKTLMAEAKIASRLASISLPVGRTFSTVMELPAMPEEELAAAIPFEAQKYVPLPLEEVVLDWSVVSATASPAGSVSSAGEPKIVGLESAPGISAGSFDESGAASSAAGSAEQGVSAEQSRVRTKGKSPISQVLLVAVPKETIAQLTQVAKLAGLEISALEQESFSLIRSLIGNDQGAYLIADLGRQSTDLIVADRGLVRLTHNLDTVDKEAVLMEIDRVANNFQMRYNKKVNQCLLSGGRANEEEVVKFLAEKLRIPVKVGDPFARLSYQTELAPLVGNLGPKLSVAIGLAMRES